MTWRPITEAELTTEIDLALDTMPDEFRHHFSVIRIQPLRLRCRRSALAEDEVIFAVASRGHQYIIYDDSEGDFGLVVLSNGASEVLQFWVLAGGLCAAMQVLESGDYSHCRVAP